MPDFSRARPSVNFEDRTGDTPHQKGMRAVRALFDPSTAISKYRDKLLEQGVISPPKGSPLRRGLPKVGGN
jgi:hypothetical protein